MMSSTDQGDVSHSVVVLLVDGVKCRALLDTGAVSSHVSAGLMNVLKKKTNQKRNQAHRTTAKNIEVFNVQIENVHRDISFEAEFCKVERRELLKLPNPHYVDLIKRHHHLRGITMDRNDQKEELPVHVIGQSGEPVTEQTQLGWTIISPGRESKSLSNMLLTRN